MDDKTLSGMKAAALAAGGRRWSARDGKIWADLSFGDREALFDMNIGRGDERWQERRNADIAHAASANPAAVLELIAEIERLTRQNDRLERSVKATRKYRDNYLLDEIDEPELCISTEQHEMLVELNDAINDVKHDSGAEQGKGD